MTSAHLALGEEPAVEEEPQEAVSDLADILKLELKYEKMRKEQEKTEEETEVGERLCVTVPHKVV